MEMGIVDFLNRILVPLLLFKIRFATLVGVVVQKQIYFSNDASQLHLSEMSLIAQQQIYKPANHRRAVNKKREYKIKPPLKSRIEKRDTSANYKNRLVERVTTKEPGHIKSP